MRLFTDRDLWLVNGEYIIDGQESVVFLRDVKGDISERQTTNVFSSLLIRRKAQRVRSIRRVPRAMIFSSMREEGTQMLSESHAFSDDRLFINTIEKNGCWTRLEEEKKIWCCSTSRLTGESCGMLTMFSEARALAFVSPTSLVEQWQQPRDSWSLLERFLRNSTTCAMPWSIEYTHTALLIIWPADRSALAATPLISFFSPSGIYEAEQSAEGYEFVSTCYKPKSFSTLSINRTDQRELSTNESLSLVES